MFADVLVMGSGLIGSSLACALGSSKLFSKILILDSAKIEPYKLNSIPDPIVVTLTPASQSFMDSIGTWDLIPEARKTSFNSMSVWDYFGTAQLQFEESTGWVVENKQIINANLQRVSDLGIELVSSAKIKKIDRKIGEVVVELEDGRVIETSLIVGADGKDSKVRKEMNIGAFKKNYSQNGLVCIVKVENKDNKAYQRFLQTGPIALLPMWDDYVSIVWSAPADVLSQLVQLNDSDFVDSVNTAISAPSFTQFPVSEQLFPYKITEICSKRITFPYSLMQAHSFIEPRVALVGDAAHTIHPLAGQGFNLGVYDVANLATVLCQGAKVGRDPGDLAYLQEYSKKARFYNTLFAGFEEGLLFSYKDSDFLSYLRNIKYFAINNLPFMKNLFVRGANGFDFIPAKWEWDK